MGSRPYSGSDSGVTIPDRFADTGRGSRHQLTSRSERWTRGTRESSGLIRKILIIVRDITALKSATGPRPCQRNEEADRGNSPGLPGHGFHEPAHHNRLEWLHMAYVRPARTVARRVDGQPRKSTRANRWPTFIPSSTAQSARLRGPPVRRSVISPARVSSPRPTPWASHIRDNIPSACGAEGAGAVVTRRTSWTSRHASAPDAVAHGALDASLEADR